MMRISTLMLFKNQTEMLKNQLQNISNTQTRLSSGKNLINSSDDPTAALNIKSIKDYISYLSSFNNSITSLQNRTTLFESSITGGINEITRAVELVKSAQNDTLNNTDRINIANELQGILQNLVNYANARDANGEYIYSGTNSQVMPFSPTTNGYQYSGSYEVSQVYASDSNSFVFDESGYNVFGNINYGNGLVMTTPGATPNTGTVQASVCQLVDNAAYVQDTYTISFVTNSSGNLAYQIIGAQTGQVVPKPPLTTPADAPQYMSGDQITFNGLSFSMQGSPALTDQIVISPSIKQNAMNTLQQIINLLNQPITNDVDRAAFHQHIDQLSAGLDTISDHFTQYLSNVGFRSQEIDRLSIENDTDNKDQEILLSTFEAADSYELISDLTQQMTSMELTQQAYVKLRSFFNDLLKNAL